MVESREPPVPGAPPTASELPAPTVPADSPAADAETWNLPAPPEHPRSAGAGRAERSADGGAGLGIGVGVGPTVEQDAVTFRVADPDARLRAVRLWNELYLPVEQVTFAPVPGGFELRLARPDVVRLEYLLELERAGGGVESVLDPANPSTVPGPFGEKSVIEFPDYVPPGWLAATAPEGATTWLALHSRRLHAEIPCLLWTPAGAAAGAELPLLVAHDGPEYARLSGLLRFLEVMVASGRLPPLRAALLQPVHRDDEYSANPAYARALALEVLPAVEREAPVPGEHAVVGMGASLGGLAALHAARLTAGLFCGLFLQSSSFFHVKFDEHEEGFAHWARITRFTTSVLRAHLAPERLPITLTCGTVEGNLTNNRLMGRALAAQGNDVQFVENRDAHNWVAWRDTFDPHLVELIRRALRLSSPSDMRQPLAAAGSPAPVPTPSQPREST